MKLRPASVPSRYVDAARGRDAIGARRLRHVVDTPLLLVAGGVREGARGAASLAEGAAAAVGGAVAGDAAVDAAGASDGGDEQRNPLLQNASDGAVLTEA